MEDGPDIMVTLSPDAHCEVLFANGAVERILQLGSKALVGTSLWRLVHPGDKIPERFWAASS